MQNLEEMKVLRHYFFFFFVACRARNSTCTDPVLERLSVTIYIREQKARSDWVVSESKDLVSRSKQCSCSRLCYQE